MTNSRAVRVDLMLDPESLVIVPGMVGSRELTVWVVFVFAFIS